MGGIGLLSGMGYGFLKPDQRIPMNARDSKHSDHMKETRLDLSGIEAEGACDVTNPLCGKKGYLCLWSSKKVKDLEKTD